MEFFLCSGCKLPSVVLQCHWSQWCTANPSIHKFPELQSKPSFWQQVGLKSCKGRKKRLPKWVSGLMFFFSSFTSTAFKVVICCFVPENLCCESVPSVFCLMLSALSKLHPHFYCNAWCCMPYCWTLQEEKLVWNWCPQTWHSIIVVYPYVLASFS